jgi:anti-sigma28 factor (negative regulator of flagellin synthesis)
MKIDVLPEALRAGWIGPAAAVQQSGEPEPVRVRAIRIEIRSGRYAPDCRKVAARVLSRIAAARRH